NAAGAKTSNAATLTVTAAAVAPTITTQPVSQAVTAGQTATFSVVATGTAPLTYQWQKNGANIAGATSASYTTPATTTADNGSTFQVVVTNAAGAKTSNAATLTVTSSSTPPVLSNVVVSNITSSSVTITWTTDQASTTQVAYGTTASYGTTTTLSSTLVTSHTTNLTGLTASTLYHFQAQSQNAGGITGVSPDATFTTLSSSAPPPAGDTVTIHETSGTAQTNRAVSISRPFVQGE